MAYLVTIPEATSTIYHYDVIEGNVQHHDHQFRDQKYEEAYRMIFLSF